MPPQKNLVKHAAKHAKKHASKKEDGKDRRRAYEHLGRVAALRRLTGDGSPDSVRALALLAKRSLEADLAEEAADLLRAAEHLSFAALLGEDKPDTRIDPELLRVVEKEFSKLFAKAEDHWGETDDRSPGLKKIFAQAHAEAKTAFEDKRYRQALELARGAEALAHIQREPGGNETRRLAPV